MRFFLHVSVMGALIISAFYAYSVKYETMDAYEQMVRLKSQIEKEKYKIASLRAEWQYLRRIERIQMLSERYLDLEPLKVEQIALFFELPDLFSPQENFFSLVQQKVQLSQGTGE